MQKKYTASIVCCARWENPYLLEWVTYYKSIGYEHIYFYCNDDDPKGAYKVLLPFLVGKDPFITFVHYAIPGMQHQMYLHFLENYAHETEWVSFFDVDEFLNLKQDYDITTFLKKYDTIDGIVFYWQVFGDNGYITNPEGFVLENYKKCGTTLSSFSKFICKTKILQDDLVFTQTGFGFWHNPLNKTYNEIVIRDIVNRSVFDVETLTPEEISIIKNTAYLHHYMIKSLDYMHHRVKRGTNGSFAGQCIWNEDDQSKKAAIEKTKVEFNAHTDDSLQNYWQSLIENGSSAFTISDRIDKCLISLHKKCCQSSISPWSVGKDIISDASQAVNGIIDGIAKFHTQKELNPWWEIDLQGKYEITDLILYNVISKTSCRFKNFKASYSLDGVNFKEFFEKNDNIPVGSIINHPLHIQTKITAQFIKIIMQGNDCFHLDQVQVYGKLFNY